jgi:pyrroline-5-carboxylate reductase
VTIPLPFIEHGGCPLPVYPQSDELTLLFGSENTIITLDQEAAIGPHFAATAILSTTMKQLNSVAHWLSAKTGNASDAERYVATLVSGYLGALTKDGKDRFIEAMEDLSTEGGLNNQLRAHITNSGFYDVLHQGLEDLHVRLKQNAAGKPSVNQAAK